MTQVSFCLDNIYEKITCGGNVVQNYFNTKVANYSVFKFHYLVLS